MVLQGFQTALQCACPEDFFFRLCFLLFNICFHILIFSLFSSLSLFLCLCMWVHVCVLFSVRVRKKSKEAAEDAGLWCLPQSPDLHQQIHHPSDGFSLRFTNWLNPSCTYIFPIITYRRLLSVVLESCFRSWYLLYKHSRTELHPQPWIWFLFSFTEKRRDFAIEQQSHHAVSVSWDPIVEGNLKIFLVQQTCVKIYVQPMLALETEHA